MKASCAVAPSRRSCPASMRRTSWRPPPAWPALSDELARVSSAPPSPPTASARYCVGEIASNFRTSRPAVSKHLRLLKSAGLVIVHERGTMNICELNAQPLRAVNEWLRDYEAYWKETLRGLQQYLEEER